MTGYSTGVAAIIVCWTRCVYRLLGLGTPQGLDTALQLDAAHANKTAIEAVNRYSMMLPFVRANMLES